MADVSKAQIREALLLMSSRTPWVTETQQRAVEGAIIGYFADDPVPAEAVPGSELALADRVQLAKVGDSTP